MTGRFTGCLPGVLLAGCVATDVPRDVGVQPAAMAQAARSPVPPRGGGPHNILLVIADDVGIDQSACYDRPVTSRAPQPTVQALCDRGVTFGRAWANPFCSPTRAGILTGRYSHRTGIGSPVSPGSGVPGLGVDEHTLPMALAAAATGHSTGAFGKWHLADDDNGGNDHPNLAGFDHFAGGIEGHVEDFYEWPRVVNGVEETSTEYVTTQTVDDAVEWITEQDGPWLASVAFHAPHWPLHLPPSDLHSYDDLDGSDEDIADNPDLYYQAMLQAVDTELGRLLASLGPAVLRDTIVIYVGDNGTYAEVNQDAYLGSHSKGTLYQGGVHVPLVVAGPGIVGRGRRVSSVVNTVDLYATIIELAGGDLGTAVPADVELDTVSMVPYLTEPGSPPQRDWVVTEVFGPKVRSHIAGRAAASSRFKLVRFENGTDELYELTGDPNEETDLLNGHFMGVYANAAYDQLGAVLDAIEDAEADEDGDTGCADTGD